MENINNENTNEDNNNEGDENVPQDEVIHDEAEGTESSFSVDSDTKDVDDSFTEEPTFAGAATPPPAPEAQFIEHRLTRDPLATFGGVLSGIAHRYGWDVSITRLAFVVALVASGGGALIVYFLAWLIIPRAMYWPPVVRNRSSQVSGRDIGIGLILLAVFVLLGVGTGQAAAILVPLALIGGGMWMLLQNPRGETAPAAAFAGMPTPPVQDAQAVSGGYQMPTVAPQPAPRRSRKSKFAIAGLIGLVLIVPLLFIGSLLIAIPFGEGEFEFDTDGSSEMVYTPGTVDDIPTTISEEGGRVVLDLSDVDFSSVDTPEERIEVDVDLDFGELEVILPQDVRVDISADADFAGDVTVFGAASEGLFPDSNVFSDDDPQLVLDLEVFGGKIDVQRAG